MADIERLGIAREVGLTQAAWGFELLRYVPNSFLGVLI